MTSKDHYKTLEITKESSIEIIKNSYRKLVTVHHPDKGGETEKFQEIQEAYEVLSDPLKKQEYDHKRSFGNGLNFMNFNFNNGQNVNINQVFDGNQMFTQMFNGNQMFNSFKTQVSESMKSKITPDVKHKLELSLQDLYNGKTFKLNVNRYVICETCFGIGHNIEKFKITNSELHKTELKKALVLKFPCEKCKGTGSKDSQIQFGPFLKVVKSPCEHCYETGYKLPEPFQCSCCKGKRIFKKNHNVEIIIPMGCKSGDHIRISDSDEYPGKTPGNIYLIIIGINEYTHVNKYIYKRINESDDLMLRISITLKDILCGKSYNIPTLDNGVLNFDLNHGEFKSVNYVKKIPDQGMPSLTQFRKDLIINIKEFNEFNLNNTIPKGNLFIQFEICFPSEIHPESLEQLRNISF
jgi:DnaJ family protein A protein 2